MVAIRSRGSSFQKTAKRPAWSKRLSDLTNPDPKPTRKTSLNDKYDQYRIASPLPVVDVTGTGGINRWSGGNEYSQRMLRNGLTEEKSRWIDDLLSGRLPPKYGPQAQEASIGRMDISRGPLETLDTTDQSLPYLSGLDDDGPILDPHSDYYDPSPLNARRDWEDPNHIGGYDGQRRRDPGVSNRRSHRSEREAYTDQSPHGQMLPPPIPPPFARNPNQASLPRWLRSPSLDSFNPEETSTPQPNESTFDPPQIENSPSPLYPPLNSPVVPLPRASRLRPPPLKGILKNNHIRPFQPKRVSEDQHDRMQGGRFHPYQPRSGPDERQNREVRFHAANNAEEAIALNRSTSPEESDDTPTHVPYNYSRSLAPTDPSLQQASVSPDQVHDFADGPQVWRDRNTSYQASHPSNTINEEMIVEVHRETVEPHRWGQEMLSRMDDNRSDEIMSYGVSAQEKKSTGMSSNGHLLRRDWQGRDALTGSRPQDLTSTNSQAHSMYESVHSQTLQEAIDYAESDELNLRELDDSINEDMDEIRPSASMPQPPDRDLYRAPKSKIQYISSESSAQSPSVLQSDEDADSEYQPSNDGLSSDEEEDMKVRRTIRMTDAAWSFDIPQEVAEKTRPRQKPKSKLQQQTKNGRTSVPARVSTNSEMIKGQNHTVVVAPSASRDPPEDSLEQIDQFSDQDPLSQTFQPVIDIEMSTPKGSQEEIQGQSVSPEMSQKPAGQRFFGDGGELGFKVWQDGY